MDAERIVTGNQVCLMFVIRSEQPYHEHETNFSLESTVHMKSIHTS